MGVRILFVEDSQDDVELQLRRLREAAIEPQWDRVQTEGALRAALDDESWDIALVDYNLPGFSGIEALRLIAELAPDLPAITVSGSIDEDTAVATMSAGAVEYVLKDNLTRLAPAVRRAVDAAAMRRRHRRAAESARLALFAVDHASLAIMTVARDGTIVYVNDFCCSVCEAEREAIIGARLWEYEPSVTESGWAALWPDIVAKKVREHGVDRVRASGLRLVLDVTMNYLDGADLVIAYGRDVTRSVEAEEQARESEALYRRIVEMATEGIWATDAEHRTTFANAQMARMLGLDVKSMLGRPATDFVFDDGRESFSREMSQRAEGALGMYSGRLRRADGGEIWVDVSSVPDVDADGVHVGSFGMFTDITERRQVDEALTSERANLAAIFEASPVAMLVLDEALNVVRVNRAALTVACGWPEDLLRHQPGSVLQPGDLLGCIHCREDVRGCGYAGDCPLCPLRNAIEAVFDGSPLRGVELALELDRSDGVRTLWLRMGAEPLEMNGERHVTVALDDITDRKQAEAGLRESEARFRLFAERIPGFVSMKDAQHRYVYLSALDRADLPEGDVDSWLGKLPGDLWTSAEAEHIDSVTERTLAGEVVDEIVEWDHGAELKYLRALHFPISSESGSPLVGGLSLDVTAQVKAEDEVRRKAEQLRRTVEGAVLAMSHVVETRDPYTAGHERRVSELATAMGQELGLEADALDGLRLAALIHDIGKISVPAEILAKPGRLSPVEFNLIKQHARAGYDILVVIDFGRPVAEIVLQHHERIDGSGYPEGLSGDDLLLETRILSVADVVEAMSSHRPYRPALGMGAALDEIRDGAGSRYDSEVAATCIRVVEQGFAFTP